MPTTCFDSFGTSVKRISFLSPKCKNSIHLRETYWSVFERQTPGPCSLFIGPYRRGIPRPGNCNDPAKSCRIRAFRQDHGRMDRCIRRCEGFFWAC
jgi:hypothetical protein